MQLGAAGIAADQQDRHLAVLQNILNGGIIIVGTQAGHIRAFQQLIHRHVIHAAGAVDNHNLGIIGHRIIFAVQLNLLIGNKCFMQAVGFDACLAYAYQLAVSIGFNINQQALNLVLGDLPVTIGSVSQIAGGITLRQINRQFLGRNIGCHRQLAVAVSLIGFLVQIQRPNHDFSHIAAVAGRSGNPAYRCAQYSRLRHIVVRPVALAIHIITDHTQHNGVNLGQADGIVRAEGALGVTLHQARIGRILNVLIVPRALFQVAEMEQHLGISRMGVIKVTRQGGHLGKLGTGNGIVRLKSAVRVTLHYTGRRHLIHRSLIRRRHIIKSQRLPCHGKSQHQSQQQKRKFLHYQTLLLRKIATIYFTIYYYYSKM